MAPPRFINTKSLELEEHGETFIRYAILSHRWVDEVTFQEWKHRRDDEEISKRSGYIKIREFCRLASKDGFDYVWVDTNCIDKTNSSELSEAINSMFSWYRDAARCYVYLHDLYTVPRTGLPTPLETARCEWFTRGWTLQELLAPQNLWIYSKNWTCIGSKSELSDVLSRLTGIEDKYLRDTQEIYRASIAKRLSWASSRQTGKAEDIAYSLLGIFDINMPLLYGEGALKAFRRLQEEIIKVSNDQTIFAWEWPLGWKPEALDWVTFFAPSPLAFKNSRHFIPAKWADKYSDDDEPNIYSMNNLGLSITLPVLDSFSASRYSFAGLRCIDTKDSKKSNATTRESQLLGIPLFRSGRMCGRLPFPPAPTPLSALRARDMMPIHACRYGNLSEMYLYSFFRDVSLHHRELNSQYYFVCFSIDSETPKSSLGGFQATPESNVYPDLGLFTIRPVKDEHIAAGVVVLGHRPVESGFSSADIFVYLGVRSRRGTLSYHCNIKSAEGLTKATERDLEGWTRRLGELGQRPWSYDRDASYNSSDSFDDRAHVDKSIGESSTCSRGAAYLGKPVGTNGSVFIPVYISIEDEYHYGGSSRASSLAAEDGD